MFDLDKPSFWDSYEKISYFFIGTYDLLFSLFLCMFRLVR